MCRDPRLVFHAQLIIASSLAYTAKTNNTFRLIMWYITFEKLLTATRRSFSVPHHRMPMVERMSTKYNRIREQQQQQIITHALSSNSSRLLSNEKIPFGRTFSARRSIGSQFQWNPACLWFLVSIRIRLNADTKKKWMKNNNNNNNVKCERRAAQTLFEYNLSKTNSNSSKTV